MANLTPVAGLDNAPQLEMTTPAVGGPGGAANAQTQALLNRIEYLRTNIPYDIPVAGRSRGSAQAWRHQGAHVAGVGRGAAIIQCELAPENWRAVRRHLIVTLR